MEIKKIDPLVVEMKDEGVLPRAIGVTTPRTSSHPLGKADHFTTAIWECSPGRFPWTYPDAELMHILAGAATFTPDVGEPISFRAGDTLFFPSGVSGQWDVIETIRKVYAIFIAASSGGPPILLGKNDQFG
ncbi:cupin domain-containing protein [Paraburkholderia bengalensis]|uniref:Cupin domain-containing protein n=1 Tax=Paraburkholderia bengalensis TaxID=2747562 RepID=A0ABU8IQR1_9BURK